MIFISSLLGMSREFLSFWGYIIVFVALFLESLPLLGSFVPGGIAILLVSGFLVRLGYFSLWKIILVSIMASVAVDSFGYILGRSRKKGFFCRRSKIFLVKSETIERVMEIVNKHTGKSLILGRINPVTRAIAPFVVGNERISFRRFFLFSIAGSLIWAVIFVSLGYALGYNYKIAETTGRYVVRIMLLFLVGFYLYYFRNLFKEGFGRRRYGNYCKKQN